MDGLLILVVVLIGLLAFVVGRLRRQCVVEREDRADQHFSHASIAALKRMRRVVDVVPHPLLLVNARGKITMANAVAASRFGWPPGKLVGMPLRDLVADVDGPGLPERLANAFAQSEQRTMRESLTCATSSGQTFPAEVSLGPAVLDREVQMVLVIVDVSIQQALAARLEEMAFHDPLTGLPNRAAIVSEIQETIEQRGASHFALLFLDFDRFKLVNDCLGHDAGDELLRQIAERLRQELRVSDKIVPARLGGDEFVVLLKDLEQPESAVTVAERLLDVFAESYKLGPHATQSTASIGVATSQQAFSDASDLIRAADQAMYEAKSRGKACYVLYDDALCQRAERQRLFEQELREALEADQLELLFQPIHSLSPERLQGVEAFVRWQHPRLGELAPAQFIPAAEDNGLIVPLGAWALDHACQQLASWPRGFGDAAPQFVHVNLSRTQLVSPVFLDSIKRTLETHGLPAGALHVDLPEDMFKNDLDVITGPLRQLRELGVKVNIDDFGVECSTWTCLHGLPIDALKIDSSFIARLEQVSDFAGLLYALITLASNLDLTIVAEGVETEKQVELLKTLGCHLGQGNFFAPPSTTFEVTAAMQSHPASRSRRRSSAGDMHSA